MSKGIQHYTAKTIVFVKEGERPKKQSMNCSVGLLFKAQDWVITVDLERQLKITPNITQS